MELRVLSCVPRQLDNLTDKLKWIDDACKEHQPHILVTPQEFFGGAVMMLKKKQFTFKELFPKLKRIAKSNKTALVIGVVEHFKEENVNKEAIWFINEKGEYQGSLYKFALPKYDHICTKGFGDIIPETEMENRFKTFELQGIHVTGMFCWEAYSDILWTGLGLLKPDLVFSMIKFGVNAWPIVRKNKAKDTNDVIDFGYGTWKEEGRWIERLRMANVWQVKCPIICSTNSWNMRPISMPLCGCISGIDGQAKDTLWHPTKERKWKEIPEKIIVDEINPMAIRASLKNKFVYKELVGEFPPFSLGKFTMMLKINRIEDRILSDREQKAVTRSIKRSPKRKGLLNLT